MLCSTLWRRCAIHLAAKAFKVSSPPVVLSVLLCFSQIPCVSGASAPPPTVIERHKVAALPGSLDDVPMLNSNSPEQVQEEGILVSTCPPEGMKCPEAHLNYKFDGRFDIFAHHVAKGSADNLRTLFIGILLKNPGKQKLQVKILSGASYLSQPDAPFVARASIESNDDGAVFSGPGSRITSDMLRNKRAEWLPEKITILPGQTVVLASLPIPVKTLMPRLNGRSTLIRLRSTGPVCASTLAMYAPAALALEKPVITLDNSCAGSVKTVAGVPVQAAPCDRLSGSAPGLNAVNNAGGVSSADLSERAPVPEEWIKMLECSGLAGPREKPATPPGTAGPFVYGRVAGVSKGSSWQAQLVDPSDNQSKSKRTRLTLPDPDEPVSYLIASLEKGTFGTGEIQSAPLPVRYPDTAFRANGNYAVHYQLDLPLFNNAASQRDVVVRLESPLKSDTTKESLSYYDPPPAKVFFRGTVLACFIDDNGSEQRCFYHLVLNQGQHGEPLVKLRLKSGEQRNVRVEFLYPPDATPPQVLTVESHI